MHDVVRWNERALEKALKTRRIVVISGARQCGKSTLLNMICGILSPNKGQIFIDGIEITSLSQKQKDKIRIQKIGYVYQDFKLIKNMSVMDNINILRLENIDVSSSEELLKKLGIDDKKNKKVANLSGGESQRVAIVRALAKKPDIILCDEPTGNLDPETGRQIISILHKVRESGTSVLMITHNLQWLTEFPGRVLVCEDRKLSERNCPCDEARSDEEQQKE